MKWFSKRPAIDYEAEYNNRARVPEHPKIFARWTKDAAAFRDAAKAEECAALGLSYGASKRQTIDLFFPDESGTTPLAMFVHGGYWRSLEPSQFSHMARGLNGRGIAVAVVGYDLCPQVTVGAIIDEIRRACLYLWGRFHQRIFIYGHSAGGHLAAAMVATDWKALDAKAPADLVPAAYAISGVFDLTPLVHVSMNADLRLDEAEARRVSPQFWPVAAGRVLDAVVGADESSEFLRQSAAIVETWKQARAQTRYEAVPGANHFTVVDPLTDPDSAMIDRLTELCERTQSIA
jgi:arylformamidase